MKTIEIKRDSCTTCTRCLRKCEVKAIQLVNGIAEIDDDLCLLCGNCIDACPQSARFYLSDASKIRTWLENKKKVVLSLDPAYEGAFPNLYGGQLITALKQVGFTAVHETAEAAGALTAELVNLANLTSTNNIITSNCPVINTMIETYFPDLLPHLASLTTPAIAHARYLKKKYGEDTLVVSASPCIARKADAYAEENAGAIDGVLTFEELTRFLDRQGIKPWSCEQSAPDNEDPGISKLYPTAGGVISALRMEKAFPDDHYMSFHISGLANCRNVLLELREGYYSNCVIEMNACPGGCVNGPVRPIGSSGFKNSLRIKGNLNHVSASPEQIARITDVVDLTRQFKDKTPALPQPSAEEVHAMLVQMGKKDKSDEMDCGACGYPTCWANAVAACQGRSSHENCIQYLHRKASSLSNLVMDSTPNMVMIISDDLKIQEFSASCEKHFRISRDEAIGRDLCEILDDTDYEWALKTKNSLRGKIIELPEYGIFVQQNITYLKEDHRLLVILIDVTKEKKMEDEAYLQKLEIAELAQKIIDKQMMSAQMIAGLLGETTAETKVTLNRLCKSLLGEEGGE